MFIFDVLIQSSFPGRTGLPLNTLIQRLIFKLHSRQLGESSTLLLEMCHREPKWPLFHRLDQIQSSVLASVLAQF